MAEYWTNRRAYLLSHEKGAIQKIDDAVRIALCFPNSYYVGMSNLGFQSAYWHFNLPENVKAERAFSEENEKPLTLETGRALDAFTAVAFSISFELDYVNVLHMLASSKIPLAREARRDHHPLVFAGGFITQFNYQPLIPFVDFILVGECEDLFLSVTSELVRYTTTRATTKQEFLKRLSMIEGVFVPAYPKDVVPLVANIDECETVSHVVTPFSEFKDMFLIELSRGCFHACNYCVSAYVYNKVRARNVDDVIASCKKGLALTSKIGFIASAPSDYPEIEALCAFLEKENVRVSFSSLRANTITRPLIKLLVRSGQRILTLAPETGSEVLRKNMNKNIRDDVFFTVAGMAKEEGIRKIKLYMMIGLPGETEDDITMNISFIKKMAEILPTRVSVTPFIPKPKTPFEECSIASKSVLREKIRAMRTHLKKMKKVTIAFDGVKTAERQAAFAKGDRTLLLEEAEKLSVEYAVSSKQ